MRLTFADDTTLECNWANAADGIFWAEVPDLSIPGAVLIFNDETKTRRMTARYDEETQTVFEGYTRLINAQTRDGAVLVGIRKEART